MVERLALLFYLVSLLTALASTFLPLFLIRNGIASSLAAWVGFYLTDRQTYWIGFRPAHGPAYLPGPGLGTALLLGTAFFVAGLTLVGLAVRFGIAHATGQLRLPVSDKNEGMIRGFNLISSIAVGSVAGLAGAIGLATFLQGSPGGSYLDVGIALTALVLGVVTLDRLPIWLAAPIAAACTTLAVVAAIGSGQAERILIQGEALAKGRPWCLVGPGGTPLITTTSQLGFFSLPKATDRFGKRLYPHLAVVIQEGEKLTYAGWSIREQKLVRANTGVPSCPARKDFAAAIRTDRLDPDLYAVGLHWYTVPPELDPEIAADQLSFRNSTLAPDPKADWPRLDRIEITLGKPRLPAHSPAEPLDSIKSLTSDDIAALSSGKERSFVGTQDGTERFVALECPEVFDDQRCAVAVGDDEVTYSFYFPITELTRWPKVVDGVANQLDKLRVQDR